MRIAIASDHRGYHLKEKVIALLKAKGHEVSDDGPSTDESVDYPDFAALVASKVSNGDLLSSRSTERLVEIWLDAEFEGGRHQRRRDKIIALEQKTGG